MIRKKKKRGNRKKRVEACFVLSFSLPSTIPKEIVKNYES